jgi:hypothetical protein
LVFIGTVESIEPNFLNRWNLSQTASMKALNDAYATAQQDRSPAALARLKDTYLKVLPDITPDQKRRVQAARTTYDLSALFYSTLDGGKKVHFRVRTLFKDEDDDDKKADDDAVQTNPAKDVRKDSKLGKANPAKGKPAKDDDSVKKAGPKESKNGNEDAFDVWTPFSDCGYDFQVGETYLVYANSDEGSGMLSASSCSRTRRVSEAGDDLAYLFFYKDKREESGRLEGFVTTNALYRLEYDQLHDPDRLKEPVGGIVVELESKLGIRYAESGPDGRFIFDGLREGSYNISAFASGYPHDITLLAGPSSLRIEGKSCASQIMLVPKKAP